MEKPAKDTKEEIKQKIDPVMKYMSAGFQILAPVVAGVLIGLWLDKHFQKDNAIYTIICSSVMIVVALYLFIKQFFKS
ncbi:MAG: AtpZ/AtpI family protein [Sphingobacteriales bacterium]|nr:MAG: AtpZ/AtpI family protein [Sphingobacteriales bacterium]